MNQLRARLRDVSAMLLIGDGVAALVAPKARATIWRGGPAPLKELMEMFQHRPRMVQAIGVAEALIGVWLVRRIAERNQDLIAAPEDEG